MSEADKLVVRGKGGLRGTADLPPAEWGCEGQVLVRLERGGEVLVPSDLLVRQEDGTLFLPLGPDEVERPPAQGRAIVIPIGREDLRVGKRVVETGRVVVRKTVREHEEVADVPLLQETVEVQRVPVGRIVDAPFPAREEGDVTVVPVFEEVLVVEKKLRLKEEVRLIRRRGEAHQPQKVVLRSEEATVERVPAQADGDPPGR